VAAGVGLSMQGVVLDKLQAGKVRTMRTTCARMIESRPEFPQHIEDERENLSLPLDTVRLIQSESAFSQGRISGQMACLVA
jgi:hypothetical protein